MKQVLILHNETGQNQVNSSLNMPARQLVLFKGLNNVTLIMKYTQCHIGFRERVMTSSAAYLPVHDSLVNNAVTTTV